MNGSIYAADAVRGDDRYINNTWSDAEKEAQVAAVWVDPNGVPVSRWNVVYVKNMNGLFKEATAFDQDISGWNVGRVTNMNEMFSGAAAFNQDISGWKVSQVTNMYEMFKGATAFNQDITGWVTTALSDSADMFLNADAWHAAFDPKSDHPASDPDTKNGPPSAWEEA